MRTLELLKPLRDRGVQIDFCTLGASGAGQLDNRIRQMGSSVFECPLDRGLRLFSGEFLRLLKAEKYDAVHSNVYYFSGKILQLAHKAGIGKRIAHFRTLHDGKKITLNRKIYHTYMRYLINRYATDILAVCRGVMDSSWKNWTNDTRCRVIYNGIDLAEFEMLSDTRAEVCKELRIDSSRRILINVGSVQPAKAHDVLLNAMVHILKQHPDVQLLLVGEGDLKNQMIDKAASLGISPSVHFLGLRSDIPRLLKAADCFVLSSRREGLPGVVLEALAAGIPVVASDLPGVREIAEFSRNITMVPPENPQALSNAAVQVLTGLEKTPFQSDPFPPAFTVSACVKALYSVYFN